MNTTEINPIAQSQWRCIASQLQDEFSCSRVTLSVQSEKSTVRFVCKSQITLLDWVPDFLFCILPTWYCRENRATIQYLFDNFGRERIVRVCSRFGLDINDRYEYGRSLSKRDIQEIFVQLGYVYKEDMIQIFTHIQQANGAYLHLSSEMVEELQTRFQGKRFVDLTRSDLDELYKIAVPFTKIETIFLNKPPTDVRSGYNKGGSFEEIQQIVVLSERIRRHGITIKGRPHLSDYYTLKQMIGAQTPLQLVIPDENGYRYVWRKDGDGGMMHAIFLQTLTQGQGPDFNSQIAFLPTQFLTQAHKKWSGWLEDLRVCMGSHAIITKFDEWRDLLNSSEKGFLRKENQQVDIIGYSLGGVQAQRLTAALLPTQKVKRLTTVCSPGVDAETASWFRKNHARFTSVPDIYVVHNYDDFVGCLGDEMLGSQCNDYGGLLSCEYLVPTSQVETGMSIQSILAKRVASSACLCWNGLAVLWSLAGSHRDELLDIGCVSYSTESREGYQKLCNPNAFINKGLGYEEARLRFLAIGRRRTFVEHLIRSYPDLATA